MLLGRVAVAVDEEASLEPALADARERVRSGLAALRSQMPAEVEIWVGGSSRALRLPGCPAGVRSLDGLAAIGPEVTRRRELLESRL